MAVEALEGKPGKAPKPIVHARDMIKKERRVYHTHEEEGSPIQELPEHHLTRMHRIGILMHIMY